MISPMAVRNWSTPLKEGQYEDFAVSIFQVAEGFSVYLTDRSSNSAASSETWSTIAEAESYARNLAIDFVHQYLNRPFPAGAHEEDLVVKWSTEQKSAHLQK